MSAEIQPDKIIKTKLFHHNNVELQLVFEPSLDIYSINIYRINSRTNHDLFGMFMSLDKAMLKFNSISL